MLTRLLRCSFLLVAGGSTISCVDSSAPETPRPPTTELLKTMIVTPAAVTMAVGDTLSLHAVAKNLYGEVLSIPDSAPVVFTSSDATKVLVDSLGKLKAIASTNFQYIKVKVAWTYGGVTVDTVVSVAVTPTRHSVASLHIVPLDSLRVGPTRELSLQSLSFVTVAAYDTNGDPVAGVYAPLEMTPGTFALGLGFMSRDSTFTSGILSNRVGPFWIRISATIYGVPLSDSVQYMGLYPAMAEVVVTQDEYTGAILSQNAGKEDIVQPCASIKFTNQGQIPIDIVFSDSTAARGCTVDDETGNILSIPSNQSKTRKFPSVGHITWTVRRSDTGGLLPAVSGTLIMKEP